MIAKPLKPCPFCGSDDIDPEGVSSFKDEEKYDKKGNLRNWREVKAEWIEHAPACNKCSATTDGDWNTRVNSHHSLAAENAALKARVGELEGLLDAVDRTLGNVGEQSYILSNLSVSVRAALSAQTPPKAGGDDV